MGLISTHCSPIRVPAAAPAIIEKLPRPSRDDIRVASAADHLLGEWRSSVPRGSLLIVIGLHARRMVRAFSLVEVLVATLVMAALGFSLYDTMISTTRGVQVDRASEARRQITLDLLERFAQPYSDVQYLFPRGDAARGPVTRELDLDQAMELVAIPTGDRALLKSILVSGSIKGFTVVWHRGLTVGGGDKLRLRKDRIWIYPVFTRVVPGAQGGSFRVFAVRES